jgi:hypothetical protein
VILDRLVHRHDSPPTDEPVITPPDPGRPLADDVVACILREHRDKLRPAVSDPLQGLHSRWNVPELVIAYRTDSGRSVGPTIDPNVKANQHRFVCISSWWNVTATDLRTVRVLGDGTVTWEASA